MAIVHKITQPVVNHPNADRLSIVTLGDVQAIANKRDDGIPRYTEGDYVVYIQDGSLLPEWLLKQLDMWDYAANKGALAGPLGNRVKASKVRGVISMGVMLPVDEDVDPLSGCIELSLTTPIGRYLVTEKHDVTDILGIRRAT